jgi:hypothetical protein
MGDVWCRCLEKWQFIAFYVSDETHLTVITAIHKIRPYISQWTVLLEISMKESAFSRCVSFTRTDIRKIYNKHITLWRPMSLSIFCPINVNKTMFIYYEMWHHVLMRSVARELEHNVCANRFDKVPRSVLVFVHVCVSVWCTTHTHQHGPNKICRHTTEPTTTLYFKWLF